MGPVDSAADKAWVPDEWTAQDEPFQATDQKPLDRRNDPTAPDNLRQRIDALPPGHPSSPYDADGTRRQPLPRLRELEAFDDEDHVANNGQAPNPIEAPTRNPSDVRFTADAEAELPADRICPFTDAEWKEHIADVRTRLEDAHIAGFSTDRQYAIDEDGEAWVPSRREIHATIIEDIYAKSSSAPCEYKAIVAGGLAGAGKTTVLGVHAGIDRSQYLTINPDDIKMEMAKRGLVPKIEGLSPMEASDLVHEESSHIAKQLAIRARADGKNLVWDITMSTRLSAEKRIDDLRDSGYGKITGIFVDIPIEVSATRADARHRQEQDAYAAGHGLGGRYVPPEVIFAQADPQWRSHNRRTFEELKPCFDQWTCFDNGVDGRNPILTDASLHDNLKEILP